MTFIKRISDNGIDHYIGNPEKLKTIDKYRDNDILEIKSHGVRVLSISIKDNKIILLEILKKKQDNYNKLNEESLKRAKVQIDILIEGDIL